MALLGGVLQSGGAAASSSVARASNASSVPWQMWKPGWRSAIAAVSFFPLLLCPRINGGGGGGRARRISHVVGEEPLLLEKKGLMMMT